MAGRLTVRRRRLIGALGLAAAVLVLHGLLLKSLGQAMAQPADPPPLQRLQAVFTRRLAVAEPPPPVARPSRRAATTGGTDGGAPLAVPALPAASAPSHDPSADVPAAVAATEGNVPAAPPTANGPVPDQGTPEAVATHAQPAANAAAPVGSSAANAASATASPPTFDWPPPTRLDYRVHGDYHGPIDGWARVQWLREGQRYQVHLDVEVGLVASRRMTSDGLLTPDGLRPRRYEERTAFLGRERRAGVSFGSQALQLNDGTELPLPPGVQDSASQFVQLSYLFTLQPELLAAGRHVDLPVALPRRLDLWRYEVVGPAQVDTPFGPVTAWHVRPHRPQAPERAGGVMTVEAWFAPGLQYLPVKMHIADPRGAVLDLLIDQPPRQAGPGR